MLKNLCMRMNKIHTEKERERDRHKETFYFLIATVTNDNQLPLKVTKSLYIVTILGQLPFMLFTEIAQTWAVQRDSVNTAIIHSYSTLGPLGALDEYPAQSNQCGCLEGDQPNSLLRSKTRPMGSGVEADLAECMLKRSKTRPM